MDRVGTIPTSSSSGSSGQVVNISEYADCSRIIIVYSYTWTYGNVIAVNNATAQWLFKEHLGNQYEPTFGAVIVSDIQSNSTFTIQCGSWGWTRVIAFK